MLKSRLNQIAKKILFRTTFLNEFSRPKYEYCLSPAQLSWLCNAISDTKLSNSKPGCIVEIGVARGMTSTFLLKHMEIEGDRRSYYCIDTFGGFTPEDINYEVKKRNKKKPDYIGFGYNDFQVFKKNLVKNGFKNAIAISADVSLVDFSALWPIDVILVDVDLYRPTLNSLRNCYRHLNDTAYVMVDDIVADSIYDGAKEAYHEFIKAENLPCVMLGKRSGLIIKREQK
jgi:hypothetical protein